MPSCFAFSVPFFAKSKKKKKLQNDFTNAKKNNIKEKNQKGIGINLRFWGQNAKKKETQVEISKDQVIEGELNQKVAIASPSKDHHLLLLDELDRGFGEACNGKSAALSSSVKELQIEVPNYEKEPAIESYVGLMQDELEQGVPEQFSSLSPRFSSPFEQAHIEDKADQDDLFSCLSSFSDVELDIDDEDFDAYSCFSSFSQEHLIEEMDQNVFDPFLSKELMNVEINEEAPAGLSPILSPPFKPFIGAGLTNMGNTCFMNSVLQCATHTEQLVKTLSCTSDHHCGQNEGFCTFCDFKEHVKRSIKNSSSHFIPVEFVHHLKNFSSDFIPGKQADAHEFLVCLLDKVNQNSNIVSDIVGGTLKNQLKCCKCDHTSYKYEPFLNLSVELEGNVNSLQSALSHFTKFEILEDARCEGCNSSGLEKQILIESAPPILILHLKRFNNNRQKIGRFVSYPIHLDMSPYTQHGGKYELYGIIEHLGTFSAGHYISIIRTSESQWHQFNDDMVTPIPAREALNKCAYILFYRKKGSPP